MEESGKGTTIKSTTKGGSDSGGSGGGCVGEELSKLQPQFGHGSYTKAYKCRSRDEHKLEKFKVISFDRPRGTALTFAAADGGGGGGSRAGFTGQKQVNSDGGGIRGQVKEAEGGWLRRWLKRMSRASRRST